MKILYINSSGKLSEEEITYNGSVYLEYESFVVGFLDGTSYVVPDSDPTGMFSSKEILSFYDRYSMDLLSSDDFFPSGRSLDFTDIHFCEQEKGVCRLYYPSYGGGEM